MLATMSFKDLRRARLLWLRDTRFNGVAKALADALERSPSQIGQWLSGHRSIEEESARFIEKQLRLGARGLDEDVPEAALGIAINAMVENWIQGDAANRSDISLANLLMSEIDDLDVPPHRLARRVRSGPWDVPLLFAVQTVTDEDIRFPAKIVGASIAAATVESGRGVAHDLSQAAPIVEQATIGWGDLMKTDLPRAFTLVARDDALAPLLSRGHKARFSTEKVAERTDLPGRKVLVADRDGHCYIREYRLRRGTHWQAVATNESAGFEPLDSVADGLRVLAVMTGVDWE
jgi:DNA-binding transcriptional regulator YdaS (Cro superfamily)